MISEKFSTNPESFNKFGRGRGIDLVNSGGMAHKLDSQAILSSYYSMKAKCSKMFCFILEPL